MMRQRYAVRLACASGPRRKSSIATAEGESGIINARKRLNDEMAEILRFKTSTFAAFGLQRNGVWGEETASQKVEHFGLWFGAFAAPPESEVQGFGADPKILTFAMMIFPKSGTGICMARAPPGLLHQMGDRPAVDRRGVLQGGDRMAAPDAAHGRKPEGDRGIDLGAGHHRSAC